MARTVSDLSAVADALVLQCNNERSIERDDPETFTKLLHVVGDRARDANRVEVPFEFIAPSPEEYWTSSSAKGIDVPLGRR